MSAARRGQTGRIDFLAHRRSGSAAACLCSAALSPRQALFSYLFAFLFFTGLSIGSLAVAHGACVDRRRLGRIVRPQLQAAVASSCPLQAVFSLPILIGLHVIYPWADPLVLAHDALLRAQSWYLDPTSFIIRTIIYFGVWFSLGRGFRSPRPSPRAIQPYRGSRFDCLRHHGDIARPSIGPCRSSRTGIRPSSA